MTDQLKARWQNGLELPLRELEKLERIFFTLQWLQDPELRRLSHAGLNKAPGEIRDVELFLLGFLDAERKVKMLDLFDAKAATFR